MRLILKTRTAARPEAWHDQSIAEGDWLALLAAAGELPKHRYDSADAVALAVKMRPIVSRVSREPGPANQLRRAVAFAAEARAGFQVWQPDRVTPWPPTT
jgi:hypothetical protein